MTQQEERADEVAEVQDQLSKCSIKNQEETESDAEDNDILAVTAGLNDLSVQPPEAPADVRLERAPDKNKTSTANRNKPYTIAQNVSLLFFISLLSCFDSIVK